MGTPRPRGPEETVLAPGAMPPPEDADLGGVARPAQIEEGRAIVASDVASLGVLTGRALPDLRLPWQEGKANIENVLNIYPRYFS